MSIEDKFAYLRATKELIRAAIIDRGVDVPVETAFRGYTDKIGGLISMDDVDQINGEVVEDKIDYLGGTKDAIRTAIIDKGVAVPAETPFREYATKISDIESGGGGGGGNELFFYRVRLIRPSGATARFAIRKMEVEDHPGGVSVLDDQRGLLTLPFTIADEEAVAPQCIGSDRAFGGEYGVSNVVDTGDNFFSAPAGTSSGLLDVSVYIMSTADVDINVVTVQVYTLSGTRVGPDTIEVTKLNPITNQWEDAWEVTQPGLWTSNEERVYYRPGYTPPDP